MKSAAEWMRWWVVALIVGYWGAQAAWAAWGENPGTNTATQMAASVMSGKIISIDPQEKTLKVKTGLFSETEFAVDDGTKISSGSQEVALQDLSPGQEVSIQYTEKDGKRLSRTITVEEENLEKEID